MWRVTGVASVAGDVWRARSSWRKAGRARLALGAGLTVAAAGALAACGHANEPSDRSGAAANGRSGADQNASPSTVAAAKGPVVLRQSAPPWTAPGAGEAAKAISAAGLAWLHGSGAVQHTHTHLDITIDGQHIDIPGEVGFDLGVQVTSPIITRDGSGIIHVESPTVRTFTLGQFFTEWEVRLSTACIGATCRSDTEAVHFYVDGMEYTSDPNSIVLRNHQEIALIAEPAGASVSPPETYDFPRGY